MHSSSPRNPTKPINGGLIRRFSASGEQHDWLRDEAARRGVTVGAVIRQLIDAARQPDEKLVSNTH